MRGLEYRGRAIRPLYPRLVMAPLLQVVPAATACHTTLPLLQRPNCVAPLQTMAPFSEQVPEPPPAEGDEGVVGTTGLPVPVGWPVTVMSVVEVNAVGSGAAVGSTGAALEAPGAKTPPGLDGTAEGATAEV